MGEKGNGGPGDLMGADAPTDPLFSLDALPLDAIKGSPDTVNAWLDTYLKYREVKELRKANEAAADAAQSASDAAAMSMASNAAAGEGGPATGVTATDRTAGETQDGKPPAT